MESQSNPTEESLLQPVLQRFLRNGAAPEQDEKGRPTINIADATRSLKLAVASLVDGANARALSWQLAQEVSWVRFPSDRDLLIAHEVLWRKRAVNEYMSAKALAVARKILASKDADFLTTMYARRTVCSVGDEGEAEMRATIEEAKRDTSDEEIIGLYGRAMRNLPKEIAIRLANEALPIARNVKNHQMLTQILLGKILACHSLAQDAEDMRYTGAMSAAESKRAIVTMRNDAQQSIREMGTIPGAQYSQALGMLALAPLYALNGEMDCARRCLDFCRISANALSNPDIDAKIEEVWEYIETF